MAKSKKKWVAFRTNATVPAEVIGAEKDQKMQVGEPVLLPADYADHVVHEGFAEKSQAPKKSEPKTSGGLSEEEKADAAKLKAAQDRVDELNAEKSEMSEGDDGWDDLIKELEEAEADLAALKPAS